MLLDFHGGDLNGFILVRGERSKLFELLETDEALDINTRADQIVLGFGTVHCKLGDVLQGQMARYMKLATS